MLWCGIGRAGSPRRPHREPQNRAQPATPVRRLPTRYWPLSPLPCQGLSRFMIFGRFLDSRAHHHKGSVDPGTAPLNKNNFRLSNCMTGKFCHCDPLVHEVPGHAQSPNSGPESNDCRWQPLRRCVLGTVRRALPMHIVDSSSSLKILAFGAAITSTKSPPEMRDIQFNSPRQISSAGIRGKPFGFDHGFLKRAELGNCQPRLPFAREPDLTDSVAIAFPPLSGGGTHHIIARRNHGHRTYFPLASWTAGHCNFCPVPDAQFFFSVIPEPKVERSRGSHLSGNLRDSSTPLRLDSECRC